MASRSTQNDPLDKFRFKVAYADGTTTVKDHAGKAVVGPDGKSMTKTSFVAAFHDFQMPKRTTTKGTYREGNNPAINQIFAGLTSMEDVVLSKGIYSSLTDPNTKNADANYNTDFYAWAQSVHTSASTDSAFNLTGLATKTTSSNSAYKKDLYIVMYDRTGAAARAWVLHNAFPVHFVPGSDLNASEDGEKSMETLTLAYEDFQELAPSSVPT